MGKNSKGRKKEVTDGSIKALARIEEARRSEATVLDLSELSLTELPESIGQLTALQELSLRGNKLTELPESIGQLIALQSLYLDNNKLTELPESIGQLTALQSLYLSGNKLAELPESFGNLKGLEELYLHGNGALGLPLEVLGATFDDYINNRGNPAKPDEIIEYYFQVQRSKRPLNEAKLILVGRGGVGKTSLVNRLNDKPFRKGERKTEGIKITEWTLQLNNAEDVRLNIWDFGGQEIMHATHQFFLTQRSLYLLVLNGREGGEDEDAEYWLKSIESFGGESPVIVVLNKIKEHPFDLNRLGLQRKYPAIREFIKTDCKDGTGIKELRKAIERETDRLEHLRDPFPSSWFSIKERLAGTRKNYLSYDEYRKLCIKLGEKDKNLQELLTAYLHNLGIALNYKDDPRLQDTHVLNPRWVTNGIYKILNSDKLEKQKGEIRLGDLADILEERKYPKKMHNFLFDLMKKFDLCFSFPNDPARYLIPELLDKQEPLEAQEFEQKSCLNFQYHYSVLPEGLLPRFIVRTHVLSEGLPRWRTGVMLEFEGNRALVRADAQDKRIFISVSGTDSGRRRLLAVIRSDFERIHRDLRNQPEEMVPLPDHPNVVMGYKKLLTMEEHGVTGFPEVVDGQVINVNTYELLNGVDLKVVQRKGKAIIPPERPVRLFYSYSHKDENLRNRLETHLKLMQREGLIETWHDRKIGAGEEWKRKIDENIERADIILLLISSDFMASDYCYEKEMKRALERHEAGEARVISVIVREVNWGKSPLAKLQVLPKDGKAVDRWSNKDSAWRNVSEGVERVVDELRSKRHRIAG
jgi:internalin A